MEGDWWLSSGRKQQNKKSPQPITMSNTVPQKHDAPGLLLTGNKCRVNMCRNMRIFWPNEDSAYRIVWSVFVVRMKTLCILRYLKCTQQIFRSDCANAGLSESSLGSHIRRYVFSRCGSHISHAMREYVFRQMSLRMCAVWQGHSLSANRIIEYYRIYEWRAKVWMIFCTYVGWSESVGAIRFRWNVNHYFHWKIQKKKKKKKKRKK